MDASEVCKLIEFQAVDTQRYATYVDAVSNVDWHWTGDRTTIHCRTIRRVQVLYDEVGIFIGTDGGMEIGDRTRIKLKF
jgi:hypothetical protein